MRATILARSDIEIGERSMIGSMSFVNKSVPADTTVAGVPAKIIMYENYRGVSTPQTEDFCNCQRGVYEQML